jgi:5-methylcytosine-specific restriction protein A
MTTHPCKQPGCPQLLTGQPFCPTHARPAWQHVTEPIPLPPDWPQIQAAVLARDSHRCRINGPRCITHATQVDHVVNRAAGGNHSPANLVAACLPCHATKSGREGNQARQAARAGRVMP